MHLNKSKIFWRRTCSEICARGTSFAAAIGLFWGNLWRRGGSSSTFGGFLVSLPPSICTALTSPLQMKK
jgi:hypothetical protein